jgi:hypothetical protein
LHCLVELSWFSQIFDNDQLEGICVEASLAERFAQVFAFLLVPNYNANAIACSQTS